MTHPTDFRTLCAEHLKAWDSDKKYAESHDALVALIEQTRAALSAPQQGMPSDEAAELSRWLAFESENALKAGRHFPASMLTSASELLARYSSLVPVVVAERLPGEGDCNAEGRCWWYMAAHTTGIFRQSSTWCLAKRVAEDFGIWTHWLPHYALPLPEVKP